MIEEHHERREIFALRTKAVRDPRTHRGTPRLRESGVHLKKRGPMIVTLRVHRADHAQVVRMAREVWKNLRHRDARRAVLGEAIVALHRDVLRLATHECVLWLPHGDRLPVPLCEFRLRIKEIHMARPAVHEKKDDRLRARREMRRTRRERIARRGVGGVKLIATE